MDYSFGNERKEIGTLVILLSFYENFMKMSRLYLSLLFNWKSKGSNEVVDFKFVFEVCLFSFLISDRLIIDSWKFSRNENF